MQIIAAIETKPGRWPPPGSAMPYAQDSIRLDPSGLHLRKGKGHGGCSGETFQQCMAAGGREG